MLIVMFLADFGVFTCPFFDMISAHGLDLFAAVLGIPTIWH
jgi:hypothetical protein